MEGLVPPHVVTREQEGGWAGRGGGQGTHYTRLASSGGYPARKPSQILLSLLRRPPFLSSPSPDPPSVSPQKSAFCLWGPGRDVPVCGRILCPHVCLPLSSNKTACSVPLRTPPKSRARSAPSYSRIHIRTILHGCRCALGEDEGVVRWVGLRFGFESWGFVCWGLEGWGWVPGCGGGLVRPLVVAIFLSVT